MDLQSHIFKVISRNFVLSSRNFNFQYFVLLSQNLDLTITYIRDTFSLFRIAITKFQLSILYLQDSFSLFRVVITKFQLLITLIRDVFL